MADITALLNSGVTLDQLIAALMTDFQDTVGKMKTDSKSAYSEAIKSIQDFYDNAAQDRETSFADRYGLLADNAANLGVDLAAGRGTQEWDRDTRYLNEAADTALATDLSWFEKMLTGQNDLYNAMLTEMAAQIAYQNLANQANGGGSGGGGGGGGRGGGSSSGGGDWKETTSLTYKGGFERDFPGFIEAVQNSDMADKWTPDQWAYFNDLIDANTEPKDMIQQIVEDNANAQMAADAAQALLGQLSSDAPSETSVPMYDGQGGFVWQNRTIPGIRNIEGIENVNRQSPTGVGTFGGRTMDPRFFTEQLIKNKYVAKDSVANNQAKLENIDSASRAYMDVMDQRRFLEDAARRTISENTDIQTRNQPIREFLQNWDPIRGWVNDSQTMDEYWRSQNVEKNQPAPEFPEQLDMSGYQVAGADRPLISNESQIGAWLQPSINQVRQNQIEAARKAAERKALEEAAARATSYRAPAQPTAPVSGGNSSKYPSRPATVATKENPHPMGTGTFGQPVRTAVPFYIAAPTKKEPPKRPGSSGGAVRYS